jgi:hypothetical protein
MHGTYLQNNVSVYNVRTLVAGALIYMHVPVHLPIVMRMKIITFETEHLEAFGTSRLSQLSQLSFS